MKHDALVNLESNGAYWTACWLDSAGQRRRKSLGAKSELSRRQAQVLCNRIAGDLSTTPERRDMELELVWRPRGAVLTLEAHIDRFMEHRVGLSAPTVKLYQQTKALLIGFFGTDRPLREINSIRAKDWLASLAEGRAEATLCKHVRNAKAIFAAAVEDKIIADNPFRRLRSTAGKMDKDWAYIDLATLGKLLEACPNAGWRLLLALCRHAGLRQGEALRLRWAHVELDKGRMTIVPPAGRTDTKHRRRTVPIVPDLRRMLEEASLDPDVASDTVIPDGTLNLTSLWRDFRFIARRAGVEPYAKWCHTLRKNRESDWAQSYPQYVVSAWLGHDITVSDDFYLKVPGELYEKAAAGEAAFPRPDPQTAPEAAKEA